MNKGHRGMMFLIFILLGIVISVQFRSIVQSDTDETIILKELKTELQYERAEKARLIEQLNGLEAEREQLLKNIGESLKNNEIDRLLNKRNFEYFRAGLTPVMGKGIVITMEDAPAIGELSVEEYIIHDRDINEILDELKANGAEAISVNGERVITTTRPVCAGPTVIVNNNRYPPPYVIEAIGDPEVLFEAVNTMSTVAFMRLVGIRVDISKQEEIRIDRYHLYESLTETFKGLEVVKSEDL
ncbi:MAG: DUF881 domain-containing protein [Clostridiaceae bacterium]|nr:DUF881 domain-containing protein [Clostridiaceae bacterium]